MKVERPDVWLHSSKTILQRPILHENTSTINKNTRNHIENYVNNNTELIYTCRDFPFSFKKSIKKWPFILKHTEPSFPDTKGLRPKIDQK